MDQELPRILTQWPEELGSILQEFRTSGSNFLLEGAPFLSRPFKILLP